MKWRLSALSILEFVLQEYFKTCVGPINMSSVRYTRERLSVVFFVPLKFGLAWRGRYGLKVIYTEPCRQEFLGPADPSFTLLKSSCK